MRHLISTAAMLCLIWVAGVAWAELWVGDSIEWMTDDSQLILRGSVVRSTPISGGPAADFEDITIRVQEVLKGTSPGAQITIRSWPLGVGSGGDFLLFLKRGHAVYRPGDYRRAIVGDRWTQRTFWNGNGNGAIDLRDPGEGEGIVTARFTLLTMDAQVLAATRARVAATPGRQAPPLGPPPRGGMTAPPGAAMVDAPYDSQVFRALYSGSAVRVFVPAP